VDRITGDATRTVGDWCAKYEELLKRRALADNTRRTYKSLGVKMAAVLGAALPLKRVTALEVSAALETLAVTDGKARLAQALRVFMRDSFREAIVQGWVTDNPVMATKISIPVTVKRSRLSLELFQATYNQVLPWLQNAMALALTSAQRREDIAEAKFTAFRDGGWWCVQASKKTKHAHRIVIPFDLKPAGFHLSLGEVVSQCRRTGIASPYLVHQTEARGNSPLGSQMWIDTISRRFTEAVARVTAMPNPPTFHEIRSLAARLYKTQGIDTKALLGHNDEETTELYENSRGSEWVRVGVRE
jgi:integrase